MILWTIRAEEEWENLKLQSKLWTTQHKVPRERKDAYLWMAKQLETKAGPPPRGCRYPIWGWVKWGGDNARRPDLRASGHLKGKTRGVLIEIEISGDRILISDFQKWHAVLNQHYLAIDEQDELEFENALNEAGLANEWPFPEPFGSRVQESWMRCLDIQNSEEVYWEKRQDRQVQGVFWELLEKDVRNITFFTAK